jgi:hypothetical protein
VNKTNKVDTNAELPEVYEVFDTTESPAEQVEVEPIDDSKQTIEIKMPDYLSSVIDYRVSAIDAVVDIINRRHTTPTGELRSAEVEQIIGIIKKRARAMDVFADRKFMPKRTCQTNYRCCCYSRSRRNGNRGSNTINRVGNKTR